MVFMVSQRRLDNLARMSQSLPDTLIIGGAGGVGRALATRLLAAGARVLAVGRDAARLAQAAPGCATAVADARDLAALRAAAEPFAPTAVVNLAGSILLKPAHLTRDEEWAETLAQNLTTAFNVVRLAAALPACSVCVLMSSAAARIGLPNHEAIAAAKGGVEALVRSAAATYAPRLRVVGVAPGLVDTPLAARICGNPTARAASERMHALGRVGTPEDIADAIAWLLAAPWATGEVVAVDGGLSRVRRG